MRKTFLASLILHVFLVTVALALSSGLFGGSSKRSAESVMLVTLSKGRVETTEMRPSTVGVRPEFNKPALLKQIQQITVNKKEAVPHVAIKPESETKEKPADNETSATDEAKENISSEDVEEGVVDIDTPPDQYVETLYTVAGIVWGKGEFDVNGEGFLPPDNSDIIRALIEKAKVYPRLAKKRGIEGTTYVNFKITPDGKPEDLHIARSSGSRILDEATVKIVKKAAPFPYVESRVEVPVSFRIRDQIEIVSNRIESTGKKNE